MSADSSRTDTTGAATEPGGGTAGSDAAGVAAATQTAATIPEPVRTKQAGSGGMWGRRLLSFALLIAVWALASLILPPTILPSPAAVGSTLFGNLQEGGTYFHIYKTMLRVISGMLIAVTGGLLLGVIMGLSKWAEQLLDNWVMVAFTVPSIVYGLVAIMWFGLNDRAAIIAVGFSGIPVVAINMWQGVKAIDTSLINMGRSFRLSRRAVIRKIVVPQTIPFLLAALRYSLGISWKIATVVELIGMSSGVGYMLHYWFGLFSMTQVLAWTLTFTIILLLIEFIILKPLDNAITRWRPSSQS